MSISKENIYKLEGRVPLKNAIPLGMQHVLAMYAGNLAPILVISGVLNIPADIKVSLLQSAMFVAGAVTFVQLRPIWKIGSGLPTVMGTSSGFIPVAIGVGLQYAAMGDWSNGYAAILGASLIGGLMEFMLGFIVKPIRKFLPHVVTGTVVTTLGISLIPVGIKFVGGGVGLEKTPGFGSIKNLLIALFVFLMIIFIRQTFTGFLSISSILIGLIAGYIVAIFVGMVDFTPVRNAAWISAPLPFFAVGHLNLAFHWDAIVPFMLVYLATTVETIGDNTGIAVGGLGRDITDKELQGAVHADGFGSMFAAIFGVMPNTSFSQNVGLIGMTKVVNRFTIGIGAGFLVLCGFFPKLGAIVSTIPNPVLGGGVLLMFSMITMSGLNLIYQSGKIAERDVVIIAASLGVAFGLSNVPEVMQHLPVWFQNIFKQAIVGAFVTALILNLLLPKSKED
ncbi:purine permease [Treponema sp. OMZ 305]|uniref:uracil-xanthine permease family protein n=1 Tax=Treponema TaxID=157 RepID=UPI001BAEDCFF|nr:MULTISPECIES: nucleobase:cation symporter-2 family protein [Treponema]QUY17825.1 purine permease [Treponema vincentii]UTC57699.1 purine permease [Treponema sp. OMZ 305]